MLSIHIFIISWIGQHENAAHIANQITPYFENVTIVFSDPDENVAPDSSFDQIRRPSELYWSDKFETCINRCQTDLMLIIHADCKMDDWRALCQRCLDIMTSNGLVAVWSPRINGTYFDLAKTKIAPVANSRLNVVAQSDGMVFAITKPLILRMRKSDYRKNIFGWGINWMICCAAYTMNRLVVVDDAFCVFHPVSTSYNADEAMKMMHEFLNQLSTTERVQYRLLSQHIAIQSARQREGVN